MRPSRPHKIQAANNGLYEVVLDEDVNRWRIRYTPWGNHMHPEQVMSEYSVEDYGTAREAMLAFERGPITYQGAEHVGGT